MILGPDGSKLSKRDAATGVFEYKANGYLPDALFNYLVRLGWSHGDQEVFTRDEVINYFDLAQVGKRVQFLISKNSIGLMVFICVIHLIGHF